jgi:hypothetical protein
MYYIVTNKSILVESAADLENLPESIIPGAIAYTAGFGSMWQKGIDGTWEVIV